MTINFGGNVYDDAGNAVNGASVKLLETGTTTQEGSTVTTDSDGRWDFSEADQDRYDVEITKGSSVRRIKWSDEISLQEIDVRNNTAAGTPAATFTNLTNNAANQVAVFSGANSTKADNDEIYLSFKLHDSAGNLDEFARMTVVATDVTTTSEDGQIEFDVIKAGNLTKVWTITSSTGAAMSFDMNVDALTIGSGTDTDVSLTFDANTSDGVITWMEDEDYFQFSDDILMATTERINIRDTAIYIYSSADGQLDLVADTEIQMAATTIDINGAVALNGAITGATTIDADTDFTVGSTVITDDVITFTPSSSDTVTMTSATNGAFSLVTVDAAAAAANIQITADGTVDIDSAGVLTLDSGAAINIEPASGSAILLDGTISIDAGVVTGATSITSTAFVGDITGDVTGTADVATLGTNVNVSANNSTDETVYPTFVDGATGTQGLESDTGLTYNPSSGVLTSTTFAGALTGNASGTAATVTGAAQTNITSLGTLTNLNVDNLNFDANIISSTNSDGDITISGNDGGSTVVAQHYDMSAGGISVFGGGTASSADTNTKIYQAGAGPINIIGTDDYSTTIAIGRWSANASAGTLAFVKDRDGTIGAATELVDGDEIGKIWFGSGDGAVNAYTYTRTAAIFSAYSDGVSASNDNPAGFKWQVNPGGEDVNHAEVMRLNKGGSLLLGTTTQGDDAKAVLYIANGTAPTSSPANSVAIYAQDASSSSELKTRDEAGNVTTLSPHNFSLVGDKSEPMAWSYYSKNPFVGKEINIDMLKFIRAVETLTSQTFVTERDLPNSEKLDWDTEEQKKYDAAQAEITRYDALDDETKLATNEPTAYTKVAEPSWIS